MNTKDILKEIESLPVRKRIYVIEKTLQTIRKNEDFEQMQNAAEALYSDYRDDTELTAFTKIDFDNFYETM